MTPEIEKTNTSLTLKRTFNASPEKIFKALTDADLLSKWYKPGEMGCEVPVFEAKVGGRYTVKMTNPEDGQVYTTHGKVLELVPNERLVKTWQWENEDADPGETVLTFELRAVDGGTELTLRHEKLANEESVQSHAEGWAGCLANLPKVL